MFDLKNHQPTFVIYIYYIYILLLFFFPPGPLLLCAAANAGVHEFAGGKSACIVRSKMGAVLGHG
jgi:hypothetical protein